jgi:hypothetical protein
MTKSKKIPSKKKLIIAILSITTSLFLLTAFLSVAPALFVNAIFQNQHNNIVTSNFDGGGEPIIHNGFLKHGLIKYSIPQINGSLNLINSIGNTSIKNVTVSFLTASQSAQNAILNGKIIGGHIGITQGFLTYNFEVSNPTNNTISKVIVDAGNGKVLYTSTGMSLNSTQFALRGMNGGFGSSHWGHGPWIHDGNRAW